jgi:hypothetical protein
VEAEQHHDNWQIKRAAAQLWLEELRKEVDAPDLWATVGQEKALSTAAASARLDDSWTSCLDGQNAAERAQIPGKDECPTPSSRQAMRV